MSNLRELRVSPSFQVIRPQITHSTKVLNAKAAPQKPHSIHGVSPGTCWAAFTLVELLAVVTIIAILAALLMPISKGMLDRAMSAKCANNLKQVGTAISISSGENNGKWLALNEIDEPRVNTWALGLKDGGYLSSVKCSICPSLRLTDNLPNAQTYGVTYLGVAKSPDDQGVMTTTLDVGNKRKKEINFFKITRPSQYVLLADSFTTRSAFGGSQYYIVQGFGTVLDEIHRRHGDRANILFADGHVSALNGAELSAIGWRSFDGGGVLTSY